MKKAKAQPIRPPATGAEPVDAEYAAALEAARARGQAAKAALLGDEMMLTAAALAEQLGISEAAVGRKRKRREVVGLDLAKGQVRYPAWQVSPDRKQLPALPRLFEILGDDPWRVARLLTQVHAELGGKTGVDALNHGDVEGVLSAAQNMAAGAFS